MTQVSRARATKAKGRPFGIAVIAAAVVLFGRSAADPRPVLADHGLVYYGNYGVTGEWRAPLLGYGSSTPMISIYPPDGIGATYTKDNAAYSQKVWWTPRIWWFDPDGTTGHTAVDGSHSDKGWYYTWVRPGNSFGSMVAFPERGATFGTAFPTWTDVNGVLQSANFAIVDYPNTTISKVFAVEFIFYWESNPDQPDDGLLSTMNDFGDGYGGLYGSVRFP